MRIMISDKTGTLYARVNCYYPRQLAKDIVKRRYITKMICTFYIRNEFPRFSLKRIELYCGKKKRKNKKNDYNTVRSSIYI